MKTLDVDTRAHDLDVREQDIAVCFLEIRSGVLADVYFSLTVVVKDIAVSVLLLVIFVQAGSDIQLVEQHERIASKRTDML